MVDVDHVVVLVVVIVVFVVLVIVFYFVLLIVVVVIIGVVLVIMLLHTSKPSAIISFTNLTLQWTSLASAAQYNKVKQRKNNK